MIPRITMPLWLGVLIETLGIATGIVILQQATPSNAELINLILLLAAFVLLWYFPHSLAHLVIGRLFGIRFRYYYLSVSGMSRIDNAFLARTGRMMPMLGVKIDRSGFKKVSAGKRAAMYASGIIVSMLTPLLTVYRAFSIDASLLALLLIAVWVSNGLFTVYFSSKVGDLDQAVKTRRPITGSRGVLKKGLKKTRSK